MKRILPILIVTMCATACVPGPTGIRHWPGDHDGDGCIEPFANDDAGHCVLPTGR